MTVLETNRRGLKISIAGLLSLLAVDVTAGEIDLEFGYAARETRVSTDNDMLYLNFGKTIEMGEFLHRFEVLTAVRNENFNGSYPAQLQAEYNRVWHSTDSLTGVGVRGNWSEDIETTGELFGSYQVFWDQMSFRANLGAQFTFGDVPGRTDNGVFLVTEVSWYATDSLVLRGGMQIDTDGEFVALGAEWQIAESDWSIFAETAVAPDEYRDLKSHDNLSVAVRWTPGLQSFRSRDLDRAERLSHRYFAVQ